MTTRGRTVIVVALGVVIALGFVLWPRGAEPDAPRTGGGAAGATGHGSAAGRDRTVPTWFGIASVGDRRITGTVFLDGKPTAATVALASAATDAGVAAVTRGAAGADGKFDLGGHRAGVYRLFATATGAVPRVVAVDCETRDAAVEVFLNACTTTVAGDVRDASGGPIGGAVIETGGFPLATTDAAGRYELCLGTGAVVLVARADGYAPAGRDVTARGSLELDFDLVPDAVAVVRVVGPAGAPVEGALVRAEPPPQGFDDGPRSALGVTDARGRIELHGLAPASYLVTAVADDLVAAAPVAIDPIPGQSIEVTIELAAAVTIQGKVVGESGTPIADVRLRWQVEQLERARAITAADGSFTMTGVPAGPGEFATDRPAFVIGGEYTAAAGAQPVDVVVAMPHVIRGKVVRGAAPVGGAEVRLVEFGGPAVASRADGGFELPFTVTGQFSLEAQSDMHGAFGTTQVTLDPERDLDGVVVDVEFGGVIAGVIVDQAGTPLAGASVRYDSSELNDFGAGVTRFDGTFSADKLRGGGAYLPTISLEGGTLPAAAGQWSATDVPQNGRVDGVRLVARVERSSVTGIVVDVKGAPVSDVLIELVPGRRETRTAVDGTFTLTSTNPGPYRIAARGSGGRTARAEGVAAKTRGLRLTLLDPGGVHVVCDPAVTSPLRLLGGGRGWQQRPILCGSTIRPLAPGSYIVMGDDVATQIEVVGGAIAEVEIRPTDRSRVDVTVTGVTAPNVTCQIQWRIERLSRTEAPVAVVGGKVVFDARRGANRVSCDGDGAGGSVSFDVGDQPMQVTVKLEPRPRPAEE